MENAVGFTGERTTDKGKGAAQLETVPLDLSGYHVSRPQFKSSAKSEESEDAITDSDVFYTPNDLLASGLKSPFSGKVERKMVFEGNGGDLSLLLETARFPNSFDAGCGDLNPEKNVLLASESISTFQVNDISSRQLKTDAAEGDAVYLVDERENCDDSFVALQTDECNDDAEDLKADDATRDEFFLSQKMTGPLDIDEISECCREHYGADFYEKIEDTDSLECTKGISNEIEVQKVLTLNAEADSILGEVGSTYSYATDVDEIFLKKNGGGEPSYSSAPIVKQEIKKESLKAEDSDLNLDKNETLTSESVSNVQVNAISYGKPDPVATNRAIFSTHAAEALDNSFCAFHIEDDNGGVEDLNAIIVTGDDSSLGQKVAEPFVGELIAGRENQDSVDFNVKEDVADKSRHASLADDSEGTRDLNLNGVELDCTLIKTSSVCEDEKIVFKPANGNLGGDRPENRALSGETISSKEGDKNGVIFVEDNSNIHGTQGVPIKCIDHIRVDIGTEEKPYSLFEEVESSHCNTSNENKVSSKQNGRGGSVSSSTQNVFSGIEDCILNPDKFVLGISSFHGNAVISGQLETAPAGEAAVCFAHEPTNSDITSFHGKAIISSQLETAPAVEAVVCFAHETTNSDNSCSASHPEDCNGGDAIRDDSSLFSKLVEPINIELIAGCEKQDKVDSFEITGVVAPAAEGKREITLNGQNLDHALLNTSPVIQDKIIVSESTNEGLDGDMLENRVLRDEPSFYKVGDIDDIECVQDISNRYEIHAMPTDCIIDYIRGDSGINADEGSAMREPGSINTNATSENEILFKQNIDCRPMSPSGAKVKQETSSEFVSTEDIGDLSFSNDDEKNTSRQQVPSEPGPSAFPSLPSIPSGLGSRAPLLEPSPGSLQTPRPNKSAPKQQNQICADPADDAEESDEIREKLQMIRVKFLRLAYRLGQTPHNVVVAQVLYRLGLAEQLRRNTNRPGVFSYDRASVIAEQLEVAGKEPLDFSCTIMVLGKSGVGKSATINSIYGDAKLHTDAFQLATKKVQGVEGIVHGIKVRIVDTPGLSSCSSDKRHNERILNSIKRFISKTPPDIVLYFDRLDMQSRDYGDVPLLRTITDVFGASIWFNALVVFTHAASAPPDGPNDSPLSYEMFVTQRSHVIQQAIHQAAGDVRLMNPVALVENHSACRMNTAGQRVLPNGQVWKPHLLLLSFASKILHEASMLLKLEDSPTGKPYGSRTRVPPLPFLLSSLLQSKPHIKLPEEQMSDEENMLEVSEETSDSDDGCDYDELPPFKCLTRSQLAKLSKTQKKAYYEELDYREKLFFKKQLKEEKRRRKLLRETVESVQDELNDDHSTENIQEVNDGSASLPVAMPDLVLPNSFDSDYPSHRYRFFDTSYKWLVRPVLETQGWDHDVGYEGLNVERLFAIKNKIPLSISGQLTKDKKDCTLQMEVSSSMKHRDGMTSSVGMDFQTVGKDMIYTLRGETKITNFKRNSATAGVSVTMLGDTMSAGVKVEDKLVITKRLRLLISGGAMTGRGDVAYGGRLEASLKDNDYPMGRALSTIALSIVDLHGDLATTCNVQSQHPLGRGSNFICHGNVSNKGNGQVGFRLNTSDQLEIALLAFYPIFRSVLRMLSVPSEAI